MTPSPEHLLSLIADRAPQLRAAGVARVHLPGVLEIDLLPGEVFALSTPEPREERNERPDDGDPLSDPDTFGGSLPRFERDWEPE